VEPPLQRLSYVVNPVFNQCATNSWRLRIRLEWRICRIQRKRDRGMNPSAPRLKLLGYLIAQVRTRLSGEPLQPYYGGDDDSSGDDDGDDMAAQKQKR
jgi:hypothetical protein